MRVLSVVTLVSPFGEYGGPVRVAVNQAQAMLAAGQDVRIVAGSRGYGDGPPGDIEGVPLHAFPARQLIPGVGFAGLASPGVIRWLRNHLAQADVVHIHAARDLITLPAAELARRQGVPYVLQTHGMIDRSSNRLAAPLDRLLTVPVLRGARRICYLTETERDALIEVAGGDLNLDWLPNGVPAAVPANAETVRRDTPSEVLYLARLAPRKRPVEFVNAALRIAADHPGVRFRLVGPDEGEGHHVTAAVDRATAQGVDIGWEGALSPGETLDRMRRATVYVLPAVDEPYPMSVLEAMSIALPVVITESCGLAGFVRSHDAGLVVGLTEKDLAGGLSTLLADPSTASAMGERGRRAVQQELGMSEVASRLADLYRS